MHVDEETSEDESDEEVGPVTVRIVSGCQFLV